MKIIFTDNSLRSLINFRGDIIKHFKQLDHEITLVVPRGELEFLPESFKNSKIVEIKSDMYSTNPVKDLFYMFKLYKVYKKIKPDYIFHYTIKPNIYGTLASKMLSIRSTSMMAGLGYVFSKNTIICKGIQKLYKFAMSFADNVLVLNKTNFDLLLERKIVRHNKLKLLNGGEGVNLINFSFLPLPENKKPVMLMIARVLYDKGYTQFVDAAKALSSKGEFRLAGQIDESNPAAVAKEIVESDVNEGYINYLGFTPNILEEIKKADCIVLPSFYFEGLNRSLMEALACGRPIITTNIPGCLETVNDGINGYLVKPKDSESLIEGVNKFLDLSNSERQKMSLASRKFAEESFNIEDVKKIYEEIINITK